MESQVLVNEQGDRAAVSESITIRGRVYKLLKTTVLFLGWVSMGLWSSSVTPCVDILKDQVHSDYEEISRALAAKSAGMIFGSVIGGYLADKFQKHVDIILGLEVLTAAISIAAVPWTPNLVLMTTAFTVNGLSQGGLSAGGNAHAISLWGKEATGPVHFIHFGYGVGTILGPSMMAAFLPRGSNITNHTQTLTTLTAVSRTYHRDYFHYVSSLTSATQNITPSSNSTVDVRIPFAITGGFTVVVAILLFAFMCFPFYKYLPRESVLEPSHLAKKTFKEIISPGECAAGNVSYGLQMFVCIFMFYVALVGKDTGVTIFIEPLAMNSPHLQLSLQQTDLLVTVYFICYAAGRLLIAVVGIWVPIQIIIFVEALTNVVALTLLIIYGLYSHLGFWLTNMLFALFTGPMFPSGMAWIDRYIKMTGLAFSILDIGIGLGSFAFTWACGYLLKTHPHVCLYYLSLGCCVAELIMLIVMQIRGSIAGDRYKSRQLHDEIENESDENNDHMDDSSPLVQ